MKTASLPRLIVALVAATLFAVSARADDSLWTVDFEEAKVTAAKDKKDIFMEFTGSDWCPPCKAMHENVFSKEEFQTEAPKHFVLLKLDNPRDKSKQTEKEQAQYKAMSAQHAITGVPTIILADETGKPYAKMVGYGGDDAIAYTKKLTKLAEVRKKRDDYLAKAAKAIGLAKAKLLAQALDGIEAEVTLTSYRDTIDEIIKLDEKDEAKLKSKYEGLVKAVDVKKQIQDIQRSGARQPQEAVKKLDTLIEEQKLTGEPLQEALFAKGALLFGSDKVASRKALEESAAAAPETEKAAQIKQIIATRFKDEEKKAPAEKKEPEAKKPEAKKPEKTESK